MQFLFSVRLLHGCEAEGRQKGHTLSNGADSPLIVCIYTLLFL